MAKVIRMTEEDLCKMIEESVVRTLQEGQGISNFLKGLNLGGLGKYAKDRIWNNGGEGEIKDKDDEDVEDYKKFKQWQQQQKNGSNSSTNNQQSNS